MQYMILAAPSFVIPANVAENAYFLSGKVDEVALCFFDSAACLAYGPDDLPLNLAELNLQWHIHLPFDLPWQAGAAQAAQTALAVTQKVSFLPITRAVLHPPKLCAQKSAELLHNFAHIWNQASGIRLLLENIQTSDLTDLPLDIFESYGLCLDIGHMLGYKQTLLQKKTDLLHKVEIAHWSAPGKQDQHLPLTALSPQEFAFAAAIAAELPHKTVHVLEIFNWAGVESSIPVLTALLKGIR